MRKKTEHFNAKLKCDQVVKILENRFGKTARQLGAEYGVHFRTIEKIRSGETWSHL